ncbi:signal peptidase I [Candidatus Bathyarchaeota archaeon]|nr:signal peptidase I [Candidatus Bathyarchaeota archaeon]
MAEMKTLKQIWKNEYFQAILLTVAMIAIVFGFWFGSQVALRTQYPALAVVSGSMLPTLNVGDVIIVQGVPASEIRADYSTGDVVVFRSPSNPDYRIVHRAVEIKWVNSSGSGYYVITTHGDNNPYEATETFHESYLIGKVVVRIPYIGNFALFVNALGSFYYFIIVIIIIVNILFSLVPSGEEEKKAGEEKAPREKRKLFGKLSLEMLVLIIINVFLLGFVLFNLFGSFVFWQIGADPPQNVTIRGMYPDLQYQSNYGEITQAFLSHDFMTYQIDCLVNGSVRFGVPAFSWLQASILVLLLFDFWILAKFLHLDKRIVQMLKRKPT